MIKEHGGNTASEAAVAAGLKWIARHQHLDGHWSLDKFHEASKCPCSGPGISNDMAGTALGLLPMLGAGFTHKGKDKEGLYAKQVERALKWIIAKQEQDGQLGDGYTHPLATIALCEAYALTQDPDLKKPAQLAVDKIVEWQGKNGGFRYQPKQDGDTSVTGWHVQALHAAKLAGLKVPEETGKNLSKFLDSVGNADGSQYGYVSNNVTAPTTSSVALLCRELNGWGPRNPGLLKGVEQLEKIAPGEIKSIYRDYYATQVMFHMAVAKPDAWEKWNVAMRDKIIKDQDNGGNANARDQKGSWDPAGDGLGKQLGRLGYTSLSVLTLEIYYRHLPLYLREAKPPKDQGL
jgi:hypothetical protein